MAFNGSGYTYNFRGDLLQGRHNFNPGGNIFKLALYTDAAALDPMVTNTYTAVGEVFDTAYPPGGNPILPVGIFNSGQGASYNLIPGGLVAWVTFQPAVWPGASFTARGGLIYNASVGNAAIAILDFGFDQVATPPQGFTVSFPQGDPTLAPIQVR